MCGSLALDTYVKSCLSQPLIYSGTGLPINIDIYVCVYVRMIRMCFFTCLYIPYIYIVHAYVPDFAGNWWSATAQLECGLLGTFVQLWDL